MRGKERRELRGNKGREGKEGKVGKMEGRERGIEARKKERGGKEEGSDW